MPTFNSAHFTAAHDSKLLGLGIPQSWIDALKKGSKLAATLLLAAIHAGLISDPTGWITALCNWMLNGGTPPTP
jgi:hypothetical protein